MSIKMTIETLAMKIEQNPIKTIFLLLSFHIFVSVIFSLVAYSSIASHLHDGNGLWNFAKDSTLYHKEAIHLVQLINESHWLEWWKLYPYHLNVKLISLIYWVTGYSLPIMFELINSLMWVISIVAIYASSRLLFQKSYITHIFTALFFFQPSLLMSSTQLLRDPILIAGLSLLCYAWIDLYKNKTTWKNILLIYFGFLFILTMRSYLIDIFVIVFVLYFVWALFRRQINLISIFLILLPMFILQFTYEHGYTVGLSPIKMDSKVGLIALDDNVKTALDDNVKTALDDSAKSTNFLDVVSARAGRLRTGFYNVNLASGSKIDTNISFENFTNVIKYFPRAVQVGFLSPFPSQWIEKGKETGYIGRVISGIETIVWYTIIFGFIFLIIKDISVLESLAPLLILAIVVIVLLGYIVPNIGAIYRMRQGFMIPFFIFGVYGVQMMTYAFLARLRKK